MINSKEVIAWLFQKQRELCKQSPRNLPPGPKFIDLNGEKHPAFGISQFDDQEKKLITGIGSPFPEGIPLSSVVLKKDRSTLVLV